MKIKSYNEFREDFLVQEGLGKEFDIPGLQFTFVNVEEDILEIFSSFGWSVEIPIENLFDSEDDNIVLVNMFQNMVAARIDNNIAKKIKCVLSAQSLDLFKDIDAGGFFSDIEIDLKRFGMINKDLETITHNIPTLGKNGYIDGITPESISILTEYLNYLLEIIGGNIFAFLKFKGKESLVYLNTQTKDDGDEQLPLIPQTVYEHPIDIGKAILLCNRIMSKLENEANISIGNPYDLKTGADVNTTTECIAYNINDTDLKIYSIINPVKLKYETKSNLLQFTIEDSTGYIDDDYINIIDFNELVASVLELL